MRRGAHLVKPSWDLVKLTQSQQTLPNVKKLGKVKDFGVETRSHSARSHKISEDHESPRTRSVSPASHVPTMETKLPLKKFQKLYSKIVVQLETVKNFTEKKRNESENLIDLRRQLQRADEFSIRFSRNNLYETKRIINEIKQLIVPYPFENVSPGHCRILCKKIILAYQAASQALQTYINYAKNPSNLEVPDKINELVLLIADLFLCCENVSMPACDVYIKNDAVKVCNELMTLLKSKIPVCEYVELKEVDLAKKKNKMNTEETTKTNKLSMYKPKTIPKIKKEIPKKKNGASCLLRMKGKQTKSDEKQAKITHEIYTQKLNPGLGNAFGGKSVKFKSEKDEKFENHKEKKVIRRSRYFTPREVRPQNDDVETMVQSIGDDEVSVDKIGSTPREIDEDKNNFKELLLEAIEEIKNSDKKENKPALNKLLNSIQNCSKPPKSIPSSERVKVFHFISNDLLEEIKNTEKELERESQEIEQESEKKETPQTESAERRLKLLFKPIKAKNPEYAPGQSIARDKIKLKLSEEAMADANKYRKAFAAYRKNNIMYKKTLANKPWELMGKVSDRIILDIIKEISLDFQNDTILRRLYLSELLEVTS